MVWQEIALSSTNIYDAGQYPSSGIFLIKHTDSSVEEFVVVNKNVHLVQYIGSRFDWENVLQGSESPASNNEITLLKLQLLKLTKSIEEQEYKQLLAMLACGHDNDKLMAEETIKTLLNTKA